MRTLLLEGKNCKSKERDVTRRKIAEYMVSYEVIYRTIGLSPFARTILLYRQLIWEKIQRREEEG